MRVCVCVHVCVYECVWVILCACERDNGITNNYAGCFEPPKAPLGSCNTPYMGKVPISLDKSPPLPQTASGRGGRGWVHAIDRYITRGDRQEHAAAMTWSSLVPGACVCLVSPRVVHS